MEKLIINAIEKNNIPQFQGKELLKVVLPLFIFAEMAISNEDASWIVNDKLEKRRNLYNFDKHLQNMLLFLRKFPNISAEVIPCGTAAYYKTEIVAYDYFYVHTHQSFNRKAKYNRRYLEKNMNYQNPKYAYFLYKLDNSKKKVVSLKYVVPHASCEQYNLEIDLTYTMEVLRTRISTTNETVQQLFDRTYGSPRLDSIRQ